MRQVLRKGFSEIVVEEVPDPALLPQHVIIRPFCSLISSGTETASLHTEGIIKGVAENPSHLHRVWSVMKSNGPVRTLAEVKAKFSDYAVLGYSGAGVIVAKHPTVRDLQIGDRVAYGGEGTGHAETICAGRLLVATMPREVTFEQASFTTLGSIALNAVRTAGISIGENVAVIGAGLVGQLIAQLVSAQGGVVFISDLRAERSELARRLGADHALLSNDALPEAVNLLTNGRGVDCVIIAAAAKSPVPCQQALQLCRERGRIVIVGAVEINLPWQEMYLREIQLLMSRAYGPGSYDPLYEKQGQDYPFSHVRWTEQRNMQEFLRLVARGRVQLSQLITHQFALAEAATAYETILNPASGSLAVLLRYPVADSIQPETEYQPQHCVNISTRTERNPGRHSAVRVALTGAGNLARWAHLPALTKLPGVTLRAIHSASGARGRSYAQRFGATYCCSDYEKLLRDPDIEVVVIVSRHEHHAAQALAALRAGKHVFLEKPMALTAHECRELCDTVRETGRQLTVGFNRRFAPFYVELKSALARRAGPAVLNCRINSPGISGTYWMADPATGGAILGEACHFTDLMYWLLETEPVSVSAFTLPAQQQEPAGENNLVASFLFADGSIGNLTYCTVGSKTSGGERVEVFAQGVGAAVEDFKQLRVNTGMPHRRSRWWAEKGYPQQMESFITAVQSGRPAEVTADDGARATIACLAMLESARTHSSRTIDWQTLKTSASLHRLNPLIASPGAVALPLHEPGVSVSATVPAASQAVVGQGNDGNF
jgi:predicted dehydrogenase/threonine dehydrogenase-like Zn-dependent dehydrogenase